MTPSFAVCSVVALEEWNCRVKFCSAEFSCQSWCFTLILRYQIINSNQNHKNEWWNKYQHDIRSGVYVMNRNDHTKQWCWDGQKKCCQENGWVVLLRCILHNLEESEESEESMFDLKTICCVSLTFSPPPRVPLCIHAAAVWRITEWQTTGLNCFKTPASALQMVNSAETFPWTPSLLLGKLWLTIWDQNLFWEHWNHSHCMSFKFSHGRLKHWVSELWMGVGVYGSGKARDQGL